MGRNLEASLAEVVEEHLGLGNDRRLGRLLVLVSQLGNITEADVLHLEVA